MQTLKLVSQCVVFLAVKLNLLFTESACTYILLDKNSLFYLFIFLFSYLLNSAADRNIFIYQFSKTPSSRFRKKKNNTYPYTIHPSHDALCKVWDVLSYESWPLYSTSAQSFSSEVWTYWKNQSLPFFYPVIFPPESDGHMAGTLPGFSNNRRDLISIPTSCHQGLLGYFVLARLKMWFESAIRTELNAMPFLPLEPSIS